MNNPVKFGLLVGFLNVLFAYSIHFSGSTFLIDSTSVWYWLYGLLLPLVVMVVGGLLERKKLGGFVTYGHALKSTFIIYAIWSTLFFIAYNIIVLNVIDPNYMERNRDKLISIEEESLRWVMELSGANKNQIAEALDESRDQIEQSVSDSIKISKSLPMKLIGIFSSVILGIPISLIAALFVRKNPKLIPKVE